jgi:AcrR family transcriptional regulator
MRARISRTADCHHRRYRITEGSEEVQIRKVGAYCARRAPPVMVDLCNWRVFVASQVEPVRRADAVRNRARVLIAAEQVFAELGLKAPVEEIARRAGVGVGTLFRHFPTKEALAVAVLDSMHDGLTEHLERALKVASPRAALFELCLSLSEYQGRHRALAEQMALKHPRKGSQAGREKIYECIAELVRRGQAAGDFRPDIGPADVVVLIAGISQAALIDEQSSRLRERYVTIIIDGLDPVSATPLPGPPPGPDAILQLRRPKRGAKPA